MPLEPFGQSAALTFGVELELQLVNLSDYDLTAASPDLLHLLDDPYFSVRYNAAHALGIRGETRAVSHLLKRLKSSGNWYVQGYYYRTLRKLGWKQKKSP